jgi:hypothetical protein
MSDDNYEGQLQISDSGGVAIKKEVWIDENPDIAVPFERVSFNPQLNTPGASTTNGQLLYN